MAQVVLGRPKQSPRPSVFFHFQRVHHLDRTRSSGFFLLVPSTQFLLAVTWSFETTANEDGEIVVAAMDLCPIWNPNSYSGKSTL